MLDAKNPRARDDGDELDRALFIDPQYFTISVINKLSIIITRPSVEVFVARPTPSSSCCGMLNCCFASCCWWLDFDWEDRDMRNGKWLIRLEVGPIKIHFLLKLPMGYQLYTSLQEVPLYVARHICTVSMQSMNLFDCLLCYCLRSENSQLHTICIIILIIIITIWYRYSAWMAWRNRNC